MSAAMGRLLTRFRNLDPTNILYVRDIYNKMGSKNYGIINRQGLPPPVYFNNRPPVPVNINRRMLALLPVKDEGGGKNILLYLLVGVPMIIGAAYFARHAISHFYHCSDDDDDSDSDDDDDDSDDYVDDSDDDVVVEGQQVPSGRETIQEFLRVNSEISAVDLACDVKMFLDVLGYPSLNGIAPDARIGSTVFVFLLLPRSHFRARGLVSAQVRRVKRATRYVMSLLMPARTPAPFHDFHHRFFD